MCFELQREVTSSVSLISLDEKQEDQPPCGNDEKEQVNENEGASGNGKHMKCVNFVRVARTKIVNFYRNNQCPKRGR